MYKCKKLGKYVFFGGWECHLCQTRLEQTTNKITNEISENSSVFEIDRDLGTLLSEKHYILVYTKNLNSLLVSSVDWISNSRPVRYTS